MVEKYDFSNMFLNAEIKPIPNLKAELLPCPFCGAEVETQGGCENWRPTFYDPDSGGDPYFISCKCGCYFSVGSQDAEEFINAWNTRTPKERGGEK